MFWKKKVPPPSNIKTPSELGAEILLMMHSGNIIFVSDTLAARRKDWLGGSVMEVMIVSPGHDPFFIYYENNRYYATMATNGGGLGLVEASQMFGDFEQYRTDVSMAVCASLVSLVYQKYGKDIRHPQMQFSHNYIHTNVIAYVEKLRQWYPIQHGSEEDEDATDRKLALVNSGRASITEFVAVTGPSPR